MIELIEERLNEKHYGALQGLKKDLRTRTITQDELDKWRDSYD